MVGAGVGDAAGFGVGYIVVGCGVGYGVGYIVGCGVGCGVGYAAGFRAQEHDWHTFVALVQFPAELEGQVVGQTVVAYVVPDHEV